MDARITIWKYYRQVNDQVALGKMNHFHFIQVPEFKLSNFNGDIWNIFHEMYWKVTAPKIKDTMKAYFRYRHTLLRLQLGVGYFVYFKMTTFVLLIDIF